MLQLTPNEKFLIHRNLVDPNDTNTYYIRAVIRDADDAIIETINLVDRGGQRFSKKWEVAAYTTGQGRYISITTRVYTDSGYTTLDTLNGQESETYLIQERVNARLSFGGAGDAVSYKKIREILREEIVGVLKENFAVLENSIEANKSVYQSLSGGLKFLASGNDQLEKLVSDVEKIVKKIPTEQVDLKEISSPLEILEKEVRNFKNSLSKTQNDLMAGIDNHSQASMSKIEKMMDSIMSDLDSKNEILADTSKKGIDEIREMVRQEVVKTLSKLPTSQVNFSELKELLSEKPEKKKFDFVKSMGF